MSADSSTTNFHADWRGIYKAGAIAAFVMLGIMVAQIIVFIAWPPPTTVAGYFALFQESKILGLLSLDLLYLVNNALLILVYLALYRALEKVSPSAMLIGLVMGLVGIASYYASSAAFEMLSLSNQYQAVSDAGQAGILVAAGQAMLETYKGTAFDVYYVLNAVTLLIFSIVMLKSKVFSKTTAIIGLIAGVLMAIPSTAGSIGLFFSLTSLVPWVIFSIMVAINLLRIKYPGK
jgi:hypothetical protein